MAVKKASSKTVTLMVASNIISCPKCMTACQVVAGDGVRIVIRHDPGTTRASVDCEDAEKVWTLPQPTIEVVEV